MRASARRGPEQRGPDASGGGGCGGWHDRWQSHGLQRPRTTPPRPVICWPMSGVCVSQALRALVPTYAGPCQEPHAQAHHPTRT
eukprot:2249577-Rhodomonas_salina.1